MVKNFSLLVNHLNIETQNELEFRQIIYLWDQCLNFFVPVEKELEKFLDTSEDLNELRRHALERSEAQIKELEVSIIEQGGFLELEEIVDTKNRLDDVDFEDHAYYKVIKKFWHWNNPDLSTLFL